LKSEFPEGKKGSSTISIICSIEIQGHAQGARTALYHLPCIFSRKIAEFELFSQLQESLHANLEDQERLEQQAWPTNRLRTFCANLAMAKIQKQGCWVLRPKSSFEHTALGSFAGRHDMSATTMFVEDHDPASRVPIFEFSRFQQVRSKMASFLEFLRQACLPHLSAKRPRA
jgi:hypothetical protein